MGRMKRMLLKLLFLWSSVIMVGLIVAAALRPCHRRSPRLRPCLCRLYFGRRKAANPWSPDRDHFNSSRRLQNASRNTDVDFGRRSGRRDREQHTQIHIDRQRATYTDTHRQTEGERSIEDWRKIMNWRGRGRCEAAAAAAEQRRRKQMELERRTQRERRRRMGGGGMDAAAAAAAVDGL